MNVIITGTASGIGRAAAGKFLQEGCDVWGVDVKERAILHPRYHHIVGDIREGAPKELPEADILINNAGTLEENEAIEVNLTGTIRFTEDILKGGSLRSILFIASFSSRVPALLIRISASGSSVGAPSRMSPII